jgi:uncharacterized protein (TIGR03382 family)
MQHTARPLRFSLFIAAALALAPATARAEDGGPDGGRTDAPQEASTLVDGDATPPQDSSVTGSDAAADASNCIAVGQPCTRTEQCCNASAYCGSFSDMSGALTCGLNTPNDLSTSSCGVTGSSTDGLGFLAPLALALGACLRGRRRR